MPTSRVSYGARRVTFGSTPPYLFRQVWLFLLIALLAGIASFVAPKVLLGRVPGIYMALAGVLPGLGIAASGIVLGVRVGREIRQAHQLSFFKCWSCGYVLEGLETQGLCPECGSPYTISELSSKWKTADALCKGRIPPKPDASSHTSG